MVTAAERRKMKVMSENLKGIAPMGGKVPKSSTKTTNPTPTKPKLTRKKAVETLVSTPAFKYEPSMPKCAGFGAKMDGVKKGLKNRLYDKI